MSELRWTLLILGVVFIAALSWWERRRPRQAFAPRLREASLSSGDARAATAERAVGGEPWIGDTDLTDTVLSDAALTGAAESGDPIGEDGARARIEPLRPGPLEELPTLIIPDAEESIVLREPTLVDPDADAAAIETIEAIESVETSETSETGETGEAIEPVRAGEPVHGARPAADPQPVAAPEASASESIEQEIPGAEGVGKVRVLDTGMSGAAAVEPIVDWPPEDERRILALRLVAPPDRFPGRSLRLALAAEGFLLGKFAIFHKPDEANRALLSAASLTRPGSFDLETMDSQRYGGLSLFAVLPGPQAPQQAFEELLATARNLNERLQGALQDERGGPLTPLRVATIRESLKGGAFTAAAASGQ